MKKIAFSEEEKIKSLKRSGMVMSLIFLEHKIDLLQRKPDQLFTNKESEEILSEITETFDESLYCFKMSFLENGHKQWFSKLEILEFSKDAIQKINLMGFRHE